ncbi:ABC-transporter extracellular N-terminal-domain-containing protein [Scheffersomyces xylosifermentans]|uniref:ABC-transporter extracellular N-terminal-domain-containing protein n=1 Tax=Scheffersomyces xylosifermentans TaxID=1304137 RepID=UPI00315CC4B4
MEHMEDSCTHFGKVRSDRKVEMSNTVEIIEMEEKATNSINIEQSDNSSLNEYHGFTEETQDNVQELARILTKASNIEDYQLDSEGLKKYLTHMSEVPRETPFLDSNTYPELDPNIPSFSANAWIKNLRKLQDSDPDYYKPSKFGIAYRDLRAYGLLSSADYKPTVLNAIWKQVERLKLSFSKADPSNYFDILKSMDALMKPGEPKKYGFSIGDESKIVYDGLTPEEIRKNYRGNVIYSSESDIHFPHLTVGDTLEFASRLSTPQNRGEGVEREAYAKHLADVYMKTYGLSHTRNTMVGNWIFMYRCNPLTYLIQASLSAGLANTTVVCKPEELVSFLAPSGTTCAAFMGYYIKIAGGYLLEPDSTSECSYCSMKYTNDFLTSVDSIYSERWRNFGIFICFIAANIGLSFFLYWLSRVPKGTREKRKIAK